MVTPHIDAAISGFSATGADSAPAASPASARAAFPKIRAEMRLIPATSTTECIIVRSVVPTYALVSPAATVETISFGTPIGSALIALRGDGGAARPAECTDRVETTLGVQSSNDLRSAAAHRLDRSGAIASVGERLHVLPRRSRDLLPRDVGHEPRHAEDARVDDHDLDARLGHAVAHVRVLVALRVERPEEDDRCAASYRVARRGNEATRRTSR